MVTKVLRLVHWRVSPPVGESKKDGLRGEQNQPPTKMSLDLIVEKKLKKWIVSRIVSSTYKFKVHSSIHLLELLSPDHRVTGVR